MGLFKRITCLEKEIASRKFLRHYVSGCFEEKQDQSVWSTVGDEGKEVTGGQLFPEFPIDIWEEPSNI